MCSAPVKESPTIYDAFLAKERRAEKADKEQVKPNGDAAVTINGRKPQQKKKPPTEQKKKETLTLEEALQRVRKTN